MNHLEGMIYIEYDWTVSLCGLVVRALAQNARGIGFNPHQGFYTFQSYCVVDKMFKRVNVNLYSIININIFRDCRTAKACHQEIIFSIIENFWNFCSNI